MTGVFYKHPVSIQALQATGEHPGMGDTFHNIQRTPRHQYRQTDMFQKKSTKYLGVGTQSEFCFTNIH
jgi:hypothetical protein